jgi:hypothetical protein
VSSLRTFYEVRSWNMRLKPKRFPRSVWAYQVAMNLAKQNPGKKFYITKSLGRFSDKGYEVW